MVARDPLVDVARHDVVEGEELASDALEPGEEINVDPVADDREEAVVPARRVDGPTDRGPFVRCPAADERRDVDDRMVLRRHGARP